MSRIFVRPDDYDTIIANPNGVVVEAQCRSPIEIKWASKHDIENDRDQYNKGFEDGREWVDAKIYSAYKALQDGFAGTAQEYLEELLNNHKEGTYDSRE